MIEDDKLIIEQARKIAILEAQLKQYKNAMRSISKILSCSNGPINGPMDRPITQVMAQCQKIEDLLILE